MFAIIGGLADAYNAIAWEDAIPFTLILIGLYWVCLLYTSDAADE